MRFFIEPIILTVNYAVSLGYKNIVLMGLSGGGWSTTVASAIDPRIQLSIPVAGSVPNEPTTLYPFYVPDYPEVTGDFEQLPLRPNYKYCGFVCMYVLSVLEEGRGQAQILHNQDPCCYQAGYLHNEIKMYNQFVHSQKADGWMQTYVTAGNIHQVNVRDKVIAASMIENLRRNGGKMKPTEMYFMPFDLL